jgi:hypothetical protein
MQELTLTSEQKARITAYIPEYLNWLSSSEGKTDVKEHRDHENFFKTMLEQNRISALTESGFRLLYKALWASRMWTNKDWYIDEKLLKPNGLEKIKKELSNLLYGEGEINLRYDKFREAVAGFGPSSISEILHVMFPDKYCLWNEKPKTVLPFLNLNLLPEKFFKYQIASGDDYLQCVQALTVIKNGLAPSGIKDFIDLDIFFWYVFNNIPKENKKPKEAPPDIGYKVERPPAPLISIDSHEGAEYYLLELGQIMGFLTYTVDKNVSFQNRKLGEISILQEVPQFAAEHIMNTVKEIDVIWFDENENPEYCFEVEHTTDIVHGLDRQVQLKHQHAKFFIVASEDRRAKFQDLVSNRFPYRSMQDRFRFISYDELARLYEAALPFSELKKKLLGE